jgi:hypothetical protein
MKMTQKERMLAAVRGKTPDMLPFAPRIDLWFHSNKERGTLPEKYRNAKSADEIALSEGWALHKIILEFMSFGEDAIIDRCLGVYRIPTQGFVSKLSGDIERLVKRQGDEFHVEYKTPVGNVSGIFIFTEEMRRSGISEPWTKEHVLKTRADYKTLGFIFENMIVEPAYSEFTSWSERIGENGMPVAYALTAGSPMHHIMKLLVDSTDFYYRHKDQKEEMSYLAESIGVYFDKVIDVMAEECRAYDVKFDLRLIEQCYADYLCWLDDEENRLMAWESVVGMRIEQRAAMIINATDKKYAGGKREQTALAQEEAFRRVIDHTDNRGEQIDRFIQSGFSRPTFYRTATRLGFDFHPE